MLIGFNGSGKSRTLKAFSGNEKGEVYFRYAHDSTDFDRLINAFSPPHPINKTSFASNIESFVRKLRSFREPWHGILPLILADEMEDLESQEDWWCFDSLLRRLQISFLKALQTFLEDESEFLSHVKNVDKERGAIFNDLKRLSLIFVYLSRESLVRKDDSKRIFLANSFFESVKAKTFWMRSKSFCELLFDFMDMLYADSAGQTIDLSSAPKNKTMWRFNITDIQQPLKFRLNKEAFSEPGFSWITNFLESNPLHSENVALAYDHLTRGVGENLLRNVVKASIALADKWLNETLAKNGLRIETIVEEVIMDASSKERFGRTILFEISTKYYEELDAGEWREMEFEHLSDGTKALIRVIQSITKNEYACKIFYIDEPETHLYPQMQRLLSFIFETLSVNRCYFLLATNSLHFCSQWGLELNTYLINKQANGSEIKRLSHMNSYAVFNSLGYGEWRRASIDSYQALLIVEGVTDILILRILDKISGFKLSRFMIAPAHGAQKSLAVAKEFASMYGQFKKKVIFLFDDDHEGLTAESAIQEMLAETSYAGHSWGETMRYPFGKPELLLKDNFRPKAFKAATVFPLLLEIDKDESIVSKFFNDDAIWIFKSLVSKILRAASDKNFCFDEKTRKLIIDFVRNKKG